MEAIKQTVLAIVADKTGYPPDMLDLDLDLEADLGVDTVKQAEMFAAVRAAYNIPRDETLKLRDFPTLAHVIQFARDRQPGSSNSNCQPSHEHLASQWRGGGSPSSAGQLRRHQPRPATRARSQSPSSTHAMQAHGSCSRSWQTCHRNVRPCGSRY